MFGQFDQLFLGKSTGLHLGVNSVSTGYLTVPASGCIPLLYSAKRLSMNKLFKVAKMPSFLTEMRFVKNCCQTTLLETIHSSIS
jgi:hypothetical protein